MNELLFFITIITCFSLILFTYKFYGKKGLFVLMGVLTVVANIQTVKLVDLFAIESALGTVLYSSTFLITDILNEKFGKKEAFKALQYGFIAMITMTFFMALTLLYKPSANDFAQSSLSLIFSLNIRITIASLVGFGLSQLIDTNLYNHLKKKNRPLWVKNNLSTMISQIVDTLSFVLITYLGVLGIKEIMIIGLSMYIFKFVVAIFDTPFMYIARKIKVRDEDKEGVTPIDMVLKGKKPELDLPYFGRQSRFYEFFDKCVSPLIGKNGIYAETNSGSNSNAYRFAKKGYKVIINDASVYSNSIAKAVMSDDIITNNIVNNNWLDNYNKSYIDIAALFAGLIDEYGYNPKIPKKLTSSLKSKITKYQKHLQEVKSNDVRAFRIYNLDLFKYLKKLEKEKIKVDVMFMDFAWPWRDGNQTDEYDTTANVFADVLNLEHPKIKIWDKSNVIDEVIKAVKLAKKTSKYVLLSNQSSNFPTPELLEVALLKNNINYEVRHTMLTDAEYEDDLGKCDFFREYLYVIKGDINE